MDLVAKFAKVKVAASSLLPEEDISFCEWQQDSCKESIRKLQVMGQRLQMLHDMDPNPGYSLESGYRDDIPRVSEQFRHYRSDTTYATSYKHFEFTPLYGIVYIQKGIRAAKSAFIHRIYKYFENKYSISVDEREMKDHEYSKYVPDYKPIVDDIRKQLGGTLDFRSIAVKRHFDLFRDQIYWRNSVVLDKKYMHINNYFYFGNRYSVNSSYQLNEAKPMKRLSVAVSIFERNEVIEDFLGSHFYGDIDPGKEMHVLNSEKVEGITFYKNSKIKIKFKTAVDAKAFYDFFEIGTIKER
jgi:hypothetical protein